MPYVDSAGTRIHYETFGSGPPVVLLNGSLMDASSWRLAGYPEALSGLTLVAMDWRGAGRSDKPHDPAAYSLELNVGDVIAVAEDAGLDRFAVFGFSWGGAIAWEIARTRPERTTALVAMGCWGRKFLTDEDFVIRHRIMPIEEYGPARFYDAMLPEEGPLPDWFRDQFAATDPAAYVAMRRGAFAWPDLDQSTVTAPALLLAGGREDPEHHSELVAAKMPNARAVVFEGLSHCQTFAATEQVAPAVSEFLTDVSG
jgi:pimeloyl-ACP methyl ester carboxylesterase